MAEGVRKPLPLRQSIYPQTGDTWQSIAQRELSGEPLERNLTANRFERHK